MTYALAPVLTTRGETKLNGENWQAYHHKDLIQHRPVQECIEYGYIYKNLQLPKDYFRAVFVRNPFEIVFSAWDKKQDFDEFIFKEVAGKKNLATQWTQYDYITNHRGQILVDFVGRFENMKMDWKKFCWIINVPNLELLRLNVSEPEDYRDYYTDRTIQKVTQLFYKDLKFFNYHYNKG